MPEIFSVDNMYSAASDASQPLAYHIPGAILGAGKSSGKRDREWLLSSARHRFPFLSATHRPTASTDSPSRL